MGVQYLAGCRGGGGGVQLTAARKERKEKRGDERQRVATAPRRATGPRHGHNPHGPAWASPQLRAAVPGLLQGCCQWGLLGIAGLGSDPKTTGSPGHPSPDAGATQRGTTGLVARHRGTITPCRAHGIAGAATRCPYVPVPGWAAHERQHPWNYRSGEDPLQPALCLLRRAQMGHGAGGSLEAEHH